MPANSRCRLRYRLARDGICRMRVRHHARDQGQLDSTSYTNVALDVSGLRAISFHLRYLLENADEVAPAMFEVSELGWYRDSHLRTVLACSSYAFKYTLFLSFVRYSVLTSI